MVKEKRWALAEAKGNDKVGKEKGKQNKNDGTAAPEMSPAQGQSTVKIF